MAKKKTEEKNEAKPKTYAERLPGFTHIAAPQPRKEGEGNAPLKMLEDNGNGAGIYADENGDEVEVRRVTDSDGKPSLIMGADERTVSVLRA